MKSRLGHRFARAAVATVAVVLCTSASAVAATTRAAATFSFSTGAPDGLIATASRPDSPGKIEIESADDFILSSSTTITSATFTGLLTGAAPVVNRVVVEIYRVFPLDSTNPPSGRVPTRVNSPSDVEFDGRDSSAGTLSWSTFAVNAFFTANNSVVNNIAVGAGGEGPVSGVETQFNVSFSPGITLPAGHYFFVPQVGVTGGEFLWLSTSHTPPLFTGDLQSWMRNENLAPDWLRIGTDIVGGTTFNAAFSLSGIFATAVTVRSLGARHVPGGVRVTWRASADPSLVGFNLFRQVRGRTTRVNRALIAARPSSGATYSLVDRLAPRGAALRYRLQAVSTNGSRSWAGATAVR